MGDATNLMFYCVVSRGVTSSNVAANVFMIEVIIFSGHIEFK